MTFLDVFVSLQLCAGVLEWLQIPSSKECIDDRCVMIDAQYDFF